MLFFINILIEKRRISINGEEEEREASRNFK